MAFRILVEDELFDNHNPLIIKDNITQIIENIELVYKKNLDPNYHDIVYRIKNQIKLAGLSPNSNLNVYMEFDELTNENVIEYLTNLMEVAVDSMTSDYQVVHIESAIKSMVDLFDVYEQINPNLEVDRKSFKQLLESAQSNRRVSNEDLSNNQALQTYYKEVLNNMDELIGETPYYTYQNIKKFVIENINNQSNISDNDLVLESFKSVIEKIWDVIHWPLKNAFDDNNSFKKKLTATLLIPAQAVVYIGTAAGIRKLYEDIFKHNNESIAEYKTISDWLDSVKNWFTSSNKTIPVNQPVTVAASQTTVDTVQQAVVTPPPEIITKIEYIRNNVDLTVFDDVKGPIHSIITKIANGEAVDNNMVNELTKYVKEIEGIPAMQPVLTQLRIMVTNRQDQFAEKFIKIVNSAADTTNQAAIDWKSNTALLATGTGVLVGGAAIGLWMFYHRIIKPQFVDLANNHFVLNRKFNTFITKNNIAKIPNFAKLQHTYNQCVTAKGVDGLIDVPKCDIEFGFGLYTIITIDLLNQIKSKGLDIGKLKTIEELYAYNAFETKLIKDYDDRIRILKTIHNMLIEYNPSTIDGILKAYQAAYFEVNKNNQSNFSNNNQFMQQRPRPGSSSLNNTRR
jgi:hypothetical protein